MTMIALEQARQHLETLGLKQAVEVLDNTLDLAASKELPYADVLAELLGVEVASRRERYLTTKTRMAHLPFQRTLLEPESGFFLVDLLCPKKTKRDANAVRHNTCNDALEVRQPWTTNRTVPIPSIPWPGPSPLWTGWSMHACWPASARGGCGTR